MRINFIKPLPPSREKEVRIWYRILIALLVTTIPAITLVTLVQLYLFIPLYRTKNALTVQLSNFNSVITQQKKDRFEQQRLHEKAVCIQRYTNDPKNPAGLLSLIIDATKESQLISVAITKKLVEIKISAATTDLVLAIVKRLTDALIDKQPAFHDVTLATLSTSQQQIHAIIKAVPMRGLCDRKYDSRAKS